MPPSTKPKRAEETMSNASKTNAPFPKIALLAEHVIDQIKAGEVIERPASLLKELIENSLDAKSNRIDIEIKNNGLDLIGIEDDGDGIEYSQLPFAFCRHATSKIEKFEDVYSLSSYGFRGEALASAASVARVHCTSCPQPPYKGGKYVVHGGRQMDHSPCSSTGHGTSLFIRDLFYNTPARLKFVKSKTAEKHALSKVLYSFIINNPTVTFSVRWDEGDRLFFPSLRDDRRAERIGQAFYTQSKKRKVLQSSGEYGGYRTEVFVSPEATKSAATRRQFLFVNGRPVEDKALHYAVTKGLPSLWPDGHSGHYCLFVYAPSDEIDINSHPNKTTVRLLRTDIVHSLAKSTIGEIDRTTSPPERGTPESARAASRPSPSPPRRGTGQEGKQPRNDIHPVVSLVAVGGRYFLVNRRTLLEEIVGGLTASAGEEECHTLPLLVGEPIPFDQSIGGKVEYLKSLGFDIDFPDANLLAIKAFPTVLSGSPFLELIRSFLASNDEDSPEESFLRQARDIAFGETELYGYLDGRQEIPPQSVKALDDDLLRSIFS